MYDMWDSPRPRKKGKEVEGWKNAKDEIGDGVMAQNNDDRTNFVMGFNDDELLVLVQKIQRYPGVGKLTGFFNEYYKSEEVEVKYRIQETDKSVNAIRNFLKNRLAQELRIDLKSNTPDIQKGTNLGLVDTLIERNLPGYRMELRVILDKRKENSESTGALDLLNIVFGTKDLDALIEMFHKDDVILRLSKVQLIADDSEGSVAIEKNLLDAYEQEKVSVKKVGSKVVQVTLDKLVELLDAKIEQVKKERQNKSEVKK